MIEQKAQLSSTPRVDSARSTIALADGGIRGGEDHRAVDALQEVHGQHRPAGQGQGPLEQPVGLVPVTLGQPHLGQPLQRVGLPGR